jgi:tRNA threonylcarbamoyladenosine biosynthesis protein TsaB
LSKPINILAIDTSTEACSVAVSMGGTLKEYYQLAPRAHTHLLLPQIDKLLQECNITLAEIDLFAFGRGPGSFTGVRIACSVIQALGFGLNKPIVPVSTLRALAQNAYLETGVERVFASIDARMQEIYWGLFEVDPQGLMQPISEEKVQSEDSIAFASLGVFQRVTGYPHAKDIALLAASDYALGHSVLAAEALPLYLRDEVVGKKAP